MNTNWADLNKDGRRLERIIRQLDTKMKESNDENWLSYLDRLIKVTHEKQQIVQIVLGVKDIIKKGKKIAV